MWFSYCNLLKVYLTSTSLCLCHWVLGVSPNLHIRGLVFRLFVCLWVSGGRKVLTQRANGAVDRSSSGTVTCFLRTGKQSRLFVYWTCRSGTMHMFISGCSAECSLISKKLLGCLPVCMLYTRLDWCFCPFVEKNKMTFDWMCFCHLEDEWWWWFDLCLN